MQATSKTTTLADQEEPEMCKPQMYKFKFTTESELNGKASLCRIVTITLLVMISITLPILSLCNYLKFIQHSFRIPGYAWVIYMIVFNTVMLILIGKFITSSIAYPYSNKLFTSHLKRTSNQRFGVEFSRCVERMTRMIKESTEKQNTDKSSSIMLGQDEEETEEDLNEDSLKNLSPKDIYMRVASNIELIELYAAVNEQLIEENPRQQSALFRRANANLTGIKETLDRLEVKVTFQHAWFPAGKFHSFWAFFNRFNVETEKKDQAINVKKFFLRYQPPEILKNEGNLQQLQRLILFTDQFIECVKQSIRRTCCLCIGNNKLFGRNDQANLILKKSFEGKQFNVQGPNGNTLDCMFFPCTQKEEVILYKNDIRSSFAQIPSDLLPKYTQKPTVLMCSPNALIYQQMVIGPNAYWLNFFLKRDINVICWNYRGYGESSIGWFDFLSPSKSKCDAERILATSIQILSLEGKIGVYGRSIGGITANHLAATYKDLIDILIIDRSLNELQGVAESKLRGSATTTIFKQWTNGWVCKNSENYLKADRTFKVITCDPLDDTIDQFVSTMAGVGQLYAKKDYQSSDYVLFYESLIFLIDLEDHQYNSQEWQYNEYPELLYSCSRNVEEDLIKNSKRMSGQNVGLGSLVADNETGASGRKRAGTQRDGAQSTFNLEFLNQRKSQIKAQDGPFFQILYILACVVNDLQAATVKLRDVIAVLKKPDFQDFKLFLQLAEVFGGGYEDDVDYNRSNLRQTQTHSESIINQLQRIIDAYDLAISTLDVQRQSSLIGGLAIYHEEFERFIHFQQRMFRNLLLIQNQVNLSNNTDFKKTAQGHLVQFACGHRGQPSRIEEKRISRLLRKSGFIPMLEELPVVQMKKQEEATRPPQKPVAVKVKPVKLDQNIKIVGGQGSQKTTVDSKLKLSIIEERPAQSGALPSELNNDYFEDAGQDSDEEEVKLQHIQIDELNESFNNSFTAEDIETNNFRKEKQNALSINLQATDTMFFGIDNQANTRQTYVPVFGRSNDKESNAKQRNMSVAQFQNSRVDELSLNLTEKESNPSATKSRNLSVISQSKTFGFD